jgi:hypothetical protein
LLPLFNLSKGEDQPLQWGVDGICPPGSHRLVDISARGGLNSLSAMSGCGYLRLPHFLSIDIYCFMDVERFCTDSFMVKVRRNFHVHGVDVRSGGSLLLAQLLKG